MGIKEYKNELKWKTPNHGDFIWVLLFILSYILVFLIIVFIFSDIGAVLMLFIGLGMFLIVLIAQLLHIDIPWKLGLILFGGLFFVLLAGLHFNVGLLNTVIFLIICFISLFSCIFPLTLLERRTTRTLSFQYRNGFSVTLNNELIYSLEVWLSENNIPFHKAYQETCHNKYFVIEPPTRGAIVLIVDKDNKEEGEFHKLMLKATRKDGRSSLVEYEKNILNIVKMGITGKDIEDGKK